MIEINKNDDEDDKSKTAWQYIGEGIGWVLFALGMCALLYTCNQIGCIGHPGM